VEGNGSADCSAKRGFLSRVSHVSRISSRGFCAQNSCVSTEAMNLIPGASLPISRLSLAGAHSSLLLALVGMFDTRISAHARSYFLVVYSDSSRV